MERHKRDGGDVFLTDEELLALIREGDTAAMDVLMDRYKELARSKAGSMFILGGDRDDLIQEGMIGLFKAIRDYDPSREASFPTFAALCVSRQIYTAVQADGRSKHLPLNMAVSLDAAAGSRDGADGSKVRQALGEMISAPDNDNPEQRVIDRESVRLMFDRIEQNLSPMEQEVLGLYLTGMDYREIAAVLARSPKSIDNALQRIRRKLK